jgi:hypothetical protein
MYATDLLDQTAPSGKRDRAEYDDPWDYHPGSLTGMLFDASGGEMDDREFDDDEFEDTDDTEDEDEEEDPGERAAREDEEDQAMRDREENDHQERQYR